MQQTQILILAIFAIPIAIMIWILWRVTIELDFKKHQPQDKMSEIRLGRPIRFSSLRSSRLDI